VPSDFASAHGAIFTWNSIYVVPSDYGLTHHAIVT